MSCVCDIVASTAVYDSDNPHNLSLSLSISQHTLYLQFFSTVIHYSLSTVFMTLSVCVFWTKMGRPEVTD